MAVEQVTEVSAAIKAALDAAGVDAFVHARDLATGDEVGYQADTPVALASVFKVPIALLLGTLIDDGTLDPLERVRVPADFGRGGGTGITGLQDDVELSLRDLAQQMITVSDNTATDVIYDKVGGKDPINAKLRRLGLTETVIEGDCEFLLTRLVEDLDLTDEEKEKLSSGGENEVLGGGGEGINSARWSKVRDVHGEAETNRSTPREMTRLLQLIWTDEAGSPEACAFVRGIMAQQVWPHRLQSGFPADVKTSGKTGTLPFIRNECGVVEYKDGGRYAVAVFTLAPTPALRNPDADRVIGAVARIAVDALRAGS